MTGKRLSNSCCADAQTFAVKWPPSSWDASNSACCLRPLPQNTIAGDAASSGRYQQGLPNRRYFDRHIGNNARRIRFREDARGRLKWCRHERFKLFPASDARVGGYRNHRIGWRSSSGVSPATTITHFVHLIVRWHQPFTIFQKASRGPQQIAVGLQPPLETVMPTALRLVTGQFADGMSVVDNRRGC